MSKGFWGYYFKHQKNESALSIIAGQARENAFVQVLTPEKAFHFRYPLMDTKPPEQASLPMRIGSSTFSTEGVSLRLREEGISIEGELRYGKLTPIRYSIMGPLERLPLPCKHQIVSMRHELSGELRLNGQKIDFDGGIGYIEGDRGVSFPQRYTWIQCSDFSVPCSIAAAVADIPVLGRSMRGVTAVLWLRGEEYRLATYLGVKLVECTASELVLKQGKYRLEIRFRMENPQALLAPVGGEMTRIIREQLCCVARFRFFEKETLLFEETSRHASVEVV